LRHSNGIFIKENSGIAIVLRNKIALALKINTVLKATPYAAHKSILPHYPVHAFKHIHASFGKCNKYASAV
jgi:hypothetical protein